MYKDHIVKFLPSTASGRASGIHPIQLPHISADTTGNALSLVEGTKEVLYSAHPQESHEESSVHLFSVGVSPPRPHEPLHARGPSLGTSLHKCPSPGVSPSLRSNPLCGRRHLDCKLFDYCCPGAEPAHVANRSRVVGQFSSLTRLFSALV